MSDANYGYRFLLLAFIVALNGFFAASEAAMLSVRKSRLQSLADLLPAARLLALAALAGIALRLTGATLGAINEIPLLGGLLELVGLVALLNFLARNAFKQQKRAELLERIRQLRRNLIS